MLFWRTSTPPLIWRIMKSPPAFLRLRGKTDQEDVHGAEGESLRLPQAWRKRRIIFVTDEPFIGKDMFTRQDFMQALAGSLTGEETIFITTHEIDEIENFIDRALILKNGEIAADVRMDALRQENKSLQSLMKEVTGYKEGNLEELLS